MTTTTTHAPAPIGQRTPCGVWVDHSTVRTLAARPGDATCPACIDDPHGLLTPAGRIDHDDADTRLA